MQEASAQRAVRGNWSGDGTDEAGAFHINDFGLRKAIANAGKDGDRFRRRAVVVAFQCVETVGVGTDDGDRRGRLLQGKEVIFILEQNECFAGHAKGELAVRFGIIVGRSNARIGISGGRVEHAETKPSGEEAAQGAVDIGLGEQTLMDRAQDCRMLRAHCVTVVAADEIHPSLKDCGNALLREWA